MIPITREQRGAEAKRLREAGAFSYTRVFLAFAWMCGLTNLLDAGYFPWLAWLLGAHR
jgi:hypothetical protein